MIGLASKILLENKLNSENANLTYFQGNRFRAYQPLLTKLTNVQTSTVAIKSKTERSANISAI